MFIFLFLFILIILFLVLFLIFRFLPASASSSSASPLSVLITGCDSGFGRHAALQFARYGTPCIIFAGCLTETGIASLIAELIENGHQEHLAHFHPFLLDVTSDASVQNAVQFVCAKLPQGANLYGLVNNAGICRLGPDPWLDASSYEQCWQVNTMGTVRMVHAFREQLIATKGRIVNVSSVCGRVALPNFGPYTVSKFALRAYTDTLRTPFHSFCRDLAPFGVSVSLIEPGFHRTPLTSSRNAQLHLEQSWNSAPMPIRKAYGDGFVKKESRLAQQLLDSSLNSQNVHEVVRAYRHALFAKYPQRQYTVGWDAHLCFMPISRLSPMLQDWILKAMLRLVGAPKPREEPSPISIV